MDGTAGAIRCGTKNASQNGSIMGPTSKEKRRERERWPRRGVDQEAHQRGSTLDQVHHRVFFFRSGDPFENENRRRGLQYISASSSPSPDHVHHALLSLHVASSELGAEAVDQPRLVPLHFFSNSSFPLSNWEMANPC